MNKVFIVLGVLALSILIFIGRISEYIVSEYVTCTHNYNNCLKCGSRNRTVVGKIPKRIHQIFFYETSDTLPDRLRNAQASWLQHHQDYTYTLWNKTSINRLIDVHYPHFRRTYDAYGHWVMRADAARYLVLHKYGGWYVDMDLVSKKSVSSLETLALRQNSSVIVRFTEPWGFSNDFIGITPQHPFLDNVLTALPVSKGWYIFPYASTMFSTGPMFMWGRYLNYPHQEEFLAVKNETFRDYIVLLHESSWHSWDGVVVWYFFKDVRTLLYIVCALVVISISLCILYRYLKVIRKTNSPKKIISPL
ncbi:uncharacterized protein LOC128246569 [Mya arenaria]|uniref:uncharacterized protein LOC128246569 n=1 Tax=Mya arenaria TaxID=6604 RepID=UPI0022E62AE7|nr:uncharacterized protein LOC128246569 [Mya arenaria]